MPDPARTAEPQALEVPVIIQGATTVPGSERRELFSENATTILVFEDGVLLNLRTKVVMGQAIFLHNEQNGKEMLCKVVEAPEDGGAGRTHLEFTATAPGFWLANAEQGSTPAGPETTAKPEEGANPGESSAAVKPNEDNLAMMSQTASNIEAKNMTNPAKESGVGPLREELVPAHEVVTGNSGTPHLSVPDFEPAATPESAASATEPTGEQIDAALKKMKGAVPTAPSDPAADADVEEVQNQRHLAAMMEREARYAKFLAAKQKKAAETARDGASLDATGDAAGTAGSAIEVAAPKVPLMEHLASGTNAKIIQIGTCVVILVSGYFIWNAMKGVFIHPSYRSAASSAASRPKPVAPAPATAPPSTTATPPATTAAAAAPPVIVAKTPVATPAISGSAPVARIKSTPSASSRGGITPNRDAAGLEQTSETARPPRTIDRSLSPDVAAKVVSQPQPTLPNWAKNMDMDGVVTLDALIDERGYATQTTVLSGPRPLQREAQRAVTLWEFQPARSGGKAVASHLTLSVEFLPPPPPKRFP